MMEQGLRELLDVLLRWMHVVAGIMWIGNSLLFNWLDRNLVKDAGGDERHFGRIWLLHSGAFYDVEKKLLAPDEMPRTLHWFKWQAYTTWLTGFALLLLLYWTGGAALMTDPSVAQLSPGQAVHLGVGVVVGAWIVYDGIWRLLGRWEGVAIALSLAILGGAIWGLTHLLSGRAAFIHVGAMLGTCMAGNVAMHIMPSQRKLVAATKEGRPQDPRFSKHAKQRSIHNNYMTFPLIFTMLSNHFSIVYGNHDAALLLGVLFVGGALVRHWLNVRFTFRRWLPALAITVIASLGTVAFFVTRPVTLRAATAPAGPPVAFSTVKFVLHERCTPCHSDRPALVSNPPAPAGVRFDTPEEFAIWK
ncbi:MAG: urate hydroxylase PuuD [Polyangiaceae bacterium]